MVPVNVRTAAQRFGLGNRISSLFVHLPVAEPEAERRYLLTVAEAEELKRGDQARGGASLVALRGTRPADPAHRLRPLGIWHQAVQRHRHQRSRPAGCRCMRSVPAWREVLPLVPLAAHHAVGVAVVSYGGRVFFGLNGDERAMPDLDVLARGIETAIDELRDLASIGHGLSTLD